MLVQRSLLLLLSTYYCTIVKRDYDVYTYYAFQIDSGSHPEAIGQELNLHLQGQIGELKDHYLYYGSKASIEKRDVPLESHIETHPQIKWAEIQIPQQRLFRRGSAPSLDPNASRITDRSVTPNMTDIRRKFNINDPGFDQQWHLVNQKDYGHDLNVTGVWEQGITGVGVVLAFIDDGLDFNHPDLKDNFWAKGSYDYNDHQALPEPKNWDDHHGTRCAGEVAAIKNDVCGVGIAYDAKVAGIRILSGALTNDDEAASINFGFQETHIYSCSWGPRDDGRTMEAAPAIVNRAVENGILNGRGGLGSIFVFATGNGGGSGDNWYICLNK
jgi:kexin